MGHWLLQGNPERWRVDDFFADHTFDELTAWSVNRHLADARKGDDVALWVAGRYAGVIALGRVIDPAYEDPGAGDAYWTDTEQAGRTRWWLPIQLTEEFRHAPITRDELRQDPRFASAAILRQPFAGNPFRLSDEEWSAILDRHQPGPADSSSKQLSGAAGAGSPAWTLQPGERIRRVELHDRYGGSGQSGISPSRKTPNILVFTDPRSGQRHGYFDQWAPDGSFHYTGEGQHGEQTMTKGNLAVRNHLADGRALRVFQGARGEVQYLGEFVLDEDEPYDLATAPSTGGGPMRQVIRFHLRPVTRPAALPDTQPLGMPFRHRDENVEVSSPTAAALRDPDAAGSGLRAHRKLENQLCALAEAAGYEPFDARPPFDPDFDLAWRTPQGIVVVEVKSCTKANQIRQLRMGIGQILDYHDTLLARGHNVQPVLYIEHPPFDRRWSTLTSRHNIHLIWPGVEHLLFAQ